MALTKRRMRTDISARERAQAAEHFMESINKAKEALGSCQLPPCKEAMVSGVFDQVAPIITSCHDLLDVAQELLLKADEQGEFR